MTKLQTAEMPQETDEEHGTSDERIRLQKVTDTWIVADLTLEENRKLAELFEGKHGSIR